MQYYKHDLYLVFNNKDYNAQYRHTEHWLHCHGSHKDDVLICLVSAGCNASDKICNASGQPVKLFNNRHKMLSAILRVVERTG